MLSNQLNALNRSININCHLRVHQFLRVTIYNICTMVGTVDTPISGPARVLSPEDELVKYSQCFCFSGHDHGTNIRW